MNRISKNLNLLVLSISVLAMTSVYWRSTKPANIETFSISLSVKDIAASKAFYEKLGFEQLKGAGSLEQKWMVMTNGAGRIGLFQGMFPKNTITFNPDDARSIYKIVKENDIPVTYSAGMDVSEGPASFSITDPDGNPILFDQHQ